MMLGIGMEMIVCLTLIISKYQIQSTELTSSLVNDGTNLYVGGNGDIQKIDPVTMDSIASWTDSDAHNIGALYYYAPYLYAETYTGEGYGEEYATVYQINPTTMVTNESWTSSNVYGSGAMNMVEGAGDLFVSDGGKIYDLNISTMTASSDIYHESFGASGQITDITYLNTFIYDAESGSFGSGSGYCVKINVTTMAAYQEYSSMTDYNAGYINTSDVVTDGTYIYFGYKNSGSGRIRKLNTSMSSVGVYSMLMALPSCAIWSIPTILALVSSGLWSRCAVLASQRLDKAIQFSLSPQRAAGYNHVLAHESGELYSVEVSARHFAILYGEAGYIVHTNQYLAPAMQKVERKPEDLIGSRVRYFRALRLVKRQDRHNIESLQAILRDHVNFSNSICNHSVDASDPLDRGETINSMVIDLTTREMHIAWGNPCENPYHTFHLDA